MSLLWRVISRLSLALLVLMAAWAGLFYYIMMDEINDEIDDTLEEYSEQIIMRYLAGAALPAADNGTNNSYHISEVTEKYAAVTRHVEYSDREVYIASMRETEPARVLRTLFSDAEGRHYELTVAIPSFEKSDLRETILWWIVFLYLGLLVAVIALNAWIIRRSFSPLYTLLGWLDELTPGRRAAPLGMDTRIKEFRRLAAAAERSAQRAGEMYEEQRAFIGNASHEMQTPIAVCLNRLEMLAGGGELSEAQLGEVLLTADTLRHLARLNSTLLLLTRIDNRQVPESSAVDVNALVREIVENCSEVYAARDIRASVTEEGVLTVTMNGELARSLFGNLVRNAFIHSPDGGEVRVRIGTHAFSVSNTAEGGPLDPQLIFQRFWQGGKRAGAMGLGLPLARSIARLYGLRLDYDHDVPADRCEDRRDDLTHTRPEGCHRFTLRT
ncbi:MAG: HAMP domain-containing histidine kinase [Rikenellaceae bacterium]|jgi:signal transduction histidine kinase|nr:HAMP domain-containing histidine kinase [Rikenellaceae bacterium]